MKITSIDTRVCNAGMRNWIFVRVETDVPGLFGWGEATLEWKTRAVVGAVEDLAPLLVGEDPRDIEHCFQKMIRHSFWRVGVIGTSAISGIEIALWDIFGKDLGVPVWRLLGGKTRDYLRTYTHLGYGDMEAVYESDSCASVVERGRAVVERGYDALKVVCVPYSHYGVDIRKVDLFGEMINSLREAVGPSIDIMLDFHGRPASESVARAYIEAAASARPLFVEEPLPPEQLENLVRLTTWSPVPIASGERLIGRREFAPPLQAHAFDIAQPDICHVGGFLEAKKIAAMAETFGIGVAPHNPLGPVAGVAALHFGIATPNVIIQEEMAGAVPWYDEVVQWPIQPKPGRWDLPEKPGLGLEINEEAVRQHPFQQDVLHPANAVLADGVVVDW